jgi:hypothetical protein
VKKKVPVVTVAEPEEAARLAGLPLEATVGLAGVADAVKDGLLGFCADVGLVVMRQLMEAELTARIGPKHAKLADRTANWHGTTTGPAVLGGRKVSVERPRGRSVEGAGGCLGGGLGDLQVRGEPDLCRLGRRDGRVSGPPPRPCGVPLRLR